MIIPVDIHQLDGVFNWTMTYRRDSDFYLPYGRFRQIKPHPTEKLELQKLIKQFGIKNKHLAGNRTETKAAWYQSSFLSYHFNVNKQLLLEILPGPHFTS
jgi:hypothetical protein